MLKDYVLSKNLIGRFAIVKLWPQLKAAEDECIARLKTTAQALDLECIEIYSDGRFVNNPSYTLAKNDVDFVIHLHYDTPKLYDAFSFVTLWNPVWLYHQWGYARCSRNLLSHDDFLSCSADPADAHLRRLIRHSPVHFPPLLNLYHSVADIVYKPSLGDQKLFYAGINWDVLGNGKTRHQALLKLLDQSDDLRIYGPTLFQNVRVWEGYKSYVREIPFDGKSMLKEISQAGISLVLSSEAHKQSELMTNRLFESIAAGAVVICDENNFAKKFFGDELLYIDTRGKVEEVAAAIFDHLNWVKKNPNDALAMVKKAQDRFRDKFSLKKNLYALYKELPERKQKIKDIIYPQNLKKIKVNINFLIPEYSPVALESHLAGILAQNYPYFSATLVIDKSASTKAYHYLQPRLNQSQIPIKILEVDYYQDDVDKEHHKSNNLGKVILQILNNLNKDDEGVVFVAPNEKIFSNHLSVLAGSLARNPSVGCATSAVILNHLFSGSQNIYETIDFRQLNPTTPMGYARFIFRTSMLPKDLNIALPYLHKKTMAALIDNNQLIQEVLATVLIDVSVAFPIGNWDEGQENEVLTSYNPNVFTVYKGFEINLPFLYYPTEIIQEQIRPKHIKWVIAQIRALYDEGISARMSAIKVKFKSLKTQGYKVNNIE